MLTLACGAWCAPCVAQQPWVFDRSVDGVADPVEVGFDAEGRLLIAAGREGLLRVAADGSRETLAPGRVDRIPRPAPTNGDLPPTVVNADPVRHRVGVRGPGGASMVDGAAWPCGRLRAPEAAALAPDGSLWIADTGNARVVRVDPTGAAVAFGERGFFPGQFVAPSGVAFDTDGPLVSDRLNHRITRLNWDGSLRDIVGLHAFRPREGQGRIHYPTSIALDASRGHLAVAEPFERRVQIFRLRRADEPVKPTPPMPSKEGVSSHFGTDCSVGRDVVAAWEPESGCVVIWDTRLDPPVHVSTFGGTGERPGHFLSPAAVQVESDDRAVWVLDALGDRLERWELQRDLKDPVQFDVFMPRLSAGVSLGVARQEAGVPEVAACDLLWRDGRLGVAFVDGSVAWTDAALGRFRADGRTARPRNDGGALRAATVDAKGRLALLWPNGIEIRGDGAPEFLPLKQVAKDPRGVAALDGGFAVADGDGDAIRRVDLRGAAQPALVAAREGPDRFDGVKAAEHGALWLPARMSVAPDGSLFVVDYGNHRLQRFAKDGGWASTFTLSKSRARNASQPTPAPSDQDVAREQSRVDAGRAVARAGTGTMELPGGAVVSWKAPSPIPRAEPFALEVKVNDAGGKPVDGLVLQVDCTMPHHGHGMNVRPVVRGTGPGAWVAEPLLLHMPGRWELSLDFTGPDGRVRRAQCRLEVE